ncbi:hypothetical protein [Bradyrhizobium cosmicum]|uniref:hypothetical protein n=1 Tax=Bradyrhizobium cosmicum TaxID=1404864 RepID=UPI0028E4AEB0|nr:hypothetical protein [Bradyrhizobium cosmicum]
MNFREVAIEAISMNKAGKPHDEIKRYIVNKALELGMSKGGYSEVEHSSAYTIRLVTTGETIAFNGHEYNYQPS